MDLTGKFLIARPNIVDPFFRRGVVFIYEHSHTGTAGVVINHRHTEHNTHTVLHSRGFETTSTPCEFLYKGGPVNDKALLMFHSAEWNSSNTLRVSDYYAVSSDDMMMFKYTTGDTPRRYKFCCGASVWHPQQIRAEIHANHWLICDLPPEMVFDQDDRELWDLAVEYSAKETMDRFF